MRCGARPGSASPAATRGVGFPRVAAGFDFHRPLRFEDEFDISIRIVAIEDKTIRYACLLTRGDERIATGTLTIICVARRPDGSR